MSEIITENLVIAFAAGEMFGSRYQIIAKLGEGGMGSVYKANDLELDEVVALKMIRPELTTNPDIVKRFKRELQLARNINHDNVIRIHDLGEIDGIKYISMKFIEGESLDQFIQHLGRLPLDQVLAIARQVCLALSAAHAQGIVHRDLKAQNIMIDSRGRAVVIDFGIARSLEGPSMTRASVLIGTPDYLSPEQIYGGEATPRTDIYSLGILLYHMATGSLPFRGETPAVLLQKHLSVEPVPPSRINPNVPRSLDKLILKCLNKKPEKRYAKVDLILAELERIDLSSLTHKLTRTGQVQPVSRPVAAPASNNPFRRWLPLVAVLAVAEIVLVVLVIGLLKEDQPPVPGGQNPPIVINGDDGRIIEPPPDDPPVTSFSDAFVEDMGELLIKKFHPFSEPTGTAVRQRAPDSIIAETSYRGTYIKGYRHSMVWSINVDGSTVSDFKVISDTSPFSPKVYETVMPLIQELIKATLRIN
jgi:serine/threonine protein kinase